MENLYYLYIQTDMYLKKYTILFLVSLLLFSSNANAQTEKECFEKLSRGIYKFNKGLDKAIIKPISTGFNKLPDPIKTGTGNFTSNIATLLTVPNHILQGQFKSAGESTASFVINSTFGILGFGNPAEKLGLKNQQEDVGQTLGTYGIGAGCYFILPILGPTTVRDTVGMVADTFIDPFSIVTLQEKELLSLSGNKLDFYSVKGVGAIDFRADNIKNFDSLEKNSIDEYAAIKSLYLQNKAKKISNTFTSKDDEWDEFNK